jgi:recombinational DNA repair ATPase RecF
MQNNRLNFSPLRFIFDIHNAHINYNLVSNSQQKILLLKLINIFAVVIYNFVKIKPILLCDEFLGSFDVNNIDYMSKYLMNENFLQSFFTTPFIHECMKIDHHDARVIHLL